MNSRYLQNDINSYKDRDSDSIDKSRASNLLSNTSVKPNDVLSLNFMPHSAQKEEKKVNSGFQVVSMSPAKK